jgi:hypothetical protein
VIRGPISSGLKIKKVNSLFISKVSGLQLNYVISLLDSLTVDELVLIDITSQDSIEVDWKQFGSIRRISLLRCSNLDLTGFLTLELQEISIGKSKAIKMDTRQVGDNDNSRLSVIAVDDFKPEVYLHGRAKEVKIYCKDINQINEHIYLSDDIGELFLPLALDLKLEKEIKLPEKLRNITLAYQSFKFMEEKLIRLEKVSIYNWGFPRHKAERNAKGYWLLDGLRFADDKGYYVLQKHS